MNLKSEDGIFNGRPIKKVFIHGRMRTLSEISNLPGISKLNLGPDVLLHRWKNGDKTEERLLRPKQHKRPNAKNPKLPEHIDGLTTEQIDNLGEERPLLIYSQGVHKDCPDGYIYVGAMDEKNYSFADFWQFQKLGLYVDNDGWRPLFIKESEILEKGWVIV